MLKRIFDVFSRRPEALTKKDHEIPQTTRTRILLWVEEIYRGWRPDFGGISRGDHSGEFWNDIARRLRFRTGDVQVARNSDPESVIQYELGCTGKQFLDFLEDIFTSDVFWYFSGDEAAMIDELNILLAIDNLPYHLTNFVRETVNDTSTSYSIHTRAYPKVIMKESEVLHQNAIAPVLTLLERPHFSGANAEYLAALADYRKGDIPDCPTKCGSAFESFLKIICDRKGWAFRQTDTAKTLVNIVLPNTSLESYFEQLLLIIATLRNKLSSAHGSGTSIKQPAKHIAQYALNATASAMLLIVQETGEY